MVVFQRGIHPLGGSEQCGALMNLDQGATSTIAQGVNPWQRRISRTDAPAVAVVVKRMHRVFWVPPKYRNIAANVLDGRKFTYRSLAQRMGLAPMTIHHALAAMARLGFGVISKALGRKGWTRFRMQSDVFVPPTVTLSGESATSVYEVPSTFVLTENVPVAGTF
jgi:hypothetical protein